MTCIIFCSLSNTDLINNNSPCSYTIERKREKQLLSSIRLNGINKVQTSFMIPKKRIAWGDKLFQHFGKHSGELLCVVINGYILIIIVIILNE